MSARETDWTRTTPYNLPSEGVVVWTMDSGGHVQQLRRQGRIWFVPDGSMYIYYVPQFWKLIEGD